MQLYTMMVTIEVMNGKRNGYNSRENWQDEQPETVGEASIRTHHGFYVARYEAGVPEDAPFYASENSDKYVGIPEKNEDNVGYKEEGRNVDDYVPVSKKGKQAWGYISKKNAEIVAGNMIDNAYVKSYLIDS